jgi:enoyl-CoA hydratase/carnithine racemase
MDDLAQTDALEVDLEDRICTVTLQRPDALNALNGELVDHLWHVFHSLRHEPDVRAVVLTGAGKKAFCAGADLEERRGMSERETLERIEDYRGCFGAVADLPKPVIAAVNGYAFGGGLELALACDIRVADAETTLGLTETKLGIIPGAGGTQRLPRIVGASKAKELIFTGRRISGERAAEIGLVDYAAPSAEVRERARTLAGETTDSAPIAIEQAKRAIDAGLQADLETGLEIESRAYAVTLPTDDRQEGLDAFREDREPEFEGR